MFLSAILVAFWAGPSLFATHSSGMDTEEAILVQDPVYQCHSDMCIPVICVSLVGIHKTLIRAWAFNEQNGDSVARFQ